MSLRVFTCTDHAGRWVGVASVVVAPDEPEARKLLTKALIDARLDNEHASFTLNELNLAEPSAVILQDGDY